MYFCILKIKLHLGISTTVAVLKIIYALFYRDKYIRIYVSCFLSSKWKMLQHFLILKVDLGFLHYGNKVNTLSFLFSFENLVGEDD